jgi:hypothetical protein
MLASVTIDFVTVPAAEPGRSAPTDAKLQFWETFDVQHQRATDPNRVSLSDDQASALERQFRARFPRTLERLINTVSPLSLTGTSEGPTESSKEQPEKDRPRVTVRLLAVEYGSLTAILEILSNETVQNTILAMLVMYSPVAFREALQTNIGVVAQVENLGGGPPIGPGDTGGVWARVKGMLRTAAAVTSLLIPVAMALVVLVGAVWVVLHQMDALHEEDARLRAERTDIVKALVDQNKSVSSSLVEYTKGSAASARALDEVMTSSVKRFVDRALASTDTAGLTASVEKMKSDMDKLTTRVSTLEGKPQPSAQVPSNCQPGLANPDCAQIQLALFRKVGKPVDPRHPQQAWTDGVGGAATLEAVHLYLTSIRAPQADFLSPSQIKDLLSQTN